jgi:prepilin-type N-terminal cleavage/methylation domain-containing protein
MEPLRRKSRDGNTEAGFTLTEMLIALFIMTFGLLSAGQLMLVAMGSSSLARSKDSAAVAAQDRLEFLADLYRRDTSAAELTVGDHAPLLVNIVNPTDNSVLNRFSVGWNVSVVPDARGKTLHARLVRVTVTPIDTAGNVNSRRLLNKVVSVSSIFSPRVK